jgi:hypothetical protein
MLPGENTVLQSHPKLTFRSGPFSYSVETSGAKSEYTVTDGSRTISVPIRWGFGAGSQTWLLERDGKMYESLVSYYLSLNALDFTTGDEHIDPKSLDEAFGRPISDMEARSCFGCHTTNSVVAGKLNPTAAQPGLECEHCHTGVTTHLAGVMHGDLSSVPPSLKKMSTEDLSNFCGQCHRSWETVVRGHWRGPVNVRFQPYRLALSRCFDGTDPRIKCVACHDPHKQVVRDPAFYDGKCLACHAPAVSAGAPQGKSCPVAKSNCQSCHMPRTTLPSGHLDFTDHFIRIVKPGESYPD